MLGLLDDTYRNRELIWLLVLKELKVRYNRSALGFVWALLHPLLLMVVLTIVFSNIIRFSIEQYSIFLISTLLPWTFFSQSLAYTADSVVGNAALLRKVSVKKSVFPIAAVLSNAINLVLSLIPLLLLLLVLHFPIHPTWLYLPVPLVPLLLFSLGCGFAVAAGNVFFHDVSHIVQIVLPAWFYFSPVIYSLDFVPPHYQLLFRLNPMSYILEGFRYPIYYGRLPPLESLAMSFGCGLLALLVGYAVFRRHQRSFLFYL